MTLDEIGDRLLAANKPGEAIGEGGFGNSIGLNILQKLFSIARFQKHISNLVDLKPFGESRFLLQVYVLVAEVRRTQTLVIFKQGHIGIAFLGTEHPNFDRSIQISHHSFRLGRQGELLIFREVEAQKIAIP